MAACCCGGMWGQDNKSSLGPGQVHSGSTMSTDTCSDVSTVPKCMIKMDIQYLSQPLHYLACGVRDIVKKAEWKALKLRDTCAPQGEY